MGRSQRNGGVLTDLLDVFVHLRIFGDLGQQAGYQLSAALTIMLIDLLFDVREAVWVVLKLLNPLFYATLRLNLKRFDGVGWRRDRRPVFRIRSHLHGGPPCMRCWVVLSPNNMQECPPFYQERLVTKSPIQVLACLARFGIADTAAATARNRRRLIGKIICSSLESPS